MKKHISLILFLIITTVTHAQIGQWTWVSGANTVGSTGSYGIMGVTSPSNLPPCRTDAATWKDQYGNFWLFGGYGVNVMLNDLWKWDGTNWTWMGGSNVANANSVYGTKGVANAANMPGARGAAAIWKDKFGNIWIFGGQVYLGKTNELWKWDGVNWTWMGGSNSQNAFGIYGTKGVADPANMPGARAFTNAWTDNSGNFFLYGGDGFSDAAYGFLNDQWKWDGTNWTWIKGTKNTNVFSVLGTRGISDANNMPASKSAAVVSKDRAGNIWLYGGVTRMNAGYTGPANDLWKWDGTNWAWINGSDVCCTFTTNYGTMGVASASNQPPPKEYLVQWTDTLGNFWIFGYDYPNDLWKWDGNYWTWVKGNSANISKGVYGTKGIGELNNTPGGRYGLMGWLDNSNSIWLFGGYGLDEIGKYGYLNDLWRFTTINSTTPVKFSAFTAKQNGENVLLQWNIAQSINVKQIEIEYSLDGNYFNRIASVNSINNISVEQSFQYTHYSPLSPINYYRLKMIAIDGNYMYSEIKKINLTEKENSLFSIYPNPARHSLTISNSIKGKMTIKDIIGKQVLRFDITKIGQNILNIDKLRKGLYYCTFTSEHGNRTTLLLKQE